MYQTIGPPNTQSKKVTELKGEMDTSGIIVGDFKTQIWILNRATRKKIKRERKDLNNTINQVLLIDIYKTFHQQKTRCTFFSSTHGLLSRIDDILGHKTS